MKNKVKNKEINQGGVNGFGRAVVNTNSEDYKALQQAIIAEAKKQSPEEKIKLELRSLKYQMETYVDERAKRKHPN